MKNLNNAFLTEKNTDFDSYFENVEDFLRERGAEEIANFVQVQDVRKNFYEKTKTVFDVVEYYFNQYVNEVGLV